MGEMDKIWASQLVTAKLSVVRITGYMVVTVEWCNSDKLLTRDTLNLCPMPSLPRFSPTLFLSLSCLQVFSLRVPYLFMSVYYREQPRLLRSPPFSLPPCPCLSPGLFPQGAPTCSGMSISWATQVVVGPLSPLPNIHVVPGFYSWPEPFKPSPINSLLEADPPAKMSVGMKLDVI